MHYTINDLPDDLDRALRERAAAEHTSLDAIIVDLLAKGLDIESPPPVKKRDLSEFVAMGKFDPETEAALRDQGRIDWEQWSDGVKRRDLSGIAGQRLITAEMKAVFEEQRRIDPELWK